MGHSDFTVRDIIEVSPRGRIERVLWLHRTDRWYFGDFLRHAAWLEWLRKGFPGASIDLASQPEYLPLYDDHRFRDLLDARVIDSTAIRSYDLVIEPTAYESGSVDDAIPLLLATWDAGWVLRVQGQPRFGGSKQDMNYFRAAHPSAIAGVRAGTPSRVELSSSEVDAVDQALARVFPGQAPIIVYNPTASNPFTRDTLRAKEVDNDLPAAEHAVILRRLLVLLPGHLFIVGASLKPGDALNTEIVSEVTRLVESERVTSVTDLGRSGATTIRGFAALLASRRVCSVTGSGTGTNTHLASLLGVPALSVERGVDAQMLDNWRGTGFQMGSFRWRNPDFRTGIHAMSWSSRTHADLMAVADAFLCDHALVHGPSFRTLFTDADAELDRIGVLVDRFLASWPDDGPEAIRCGQTLLELMRAPARAHFGAFADEAAYLNLQYGIHGKGLTALAEAVTLDDGEIPGCGIGLFEDSNLHKLFTRLSTHLTSVTLPAPILTSESVR